jgi:DNA-binding transcriptional LysR family regulator
VQIQRALDARDLDAGVTYTDNEPLANVQIYPLYREHYVLLTPRGLHPEGTAEVTWRNAAKLPLCLLTRDMQNRRIVDRLFVEGGAEAPAVAVETDSLLCLAAHICSGTWSSILPHTFAPVLGHNDAAPGFLAIPLVEPRATRTIGLVVSGRTPLAPVARAFLDVAREADIAATVQSSEAASPA